MDRVSPTERILTVPGDDRFFVSGFFVTDTGDGRQTGFKVETDLFRRGIIETFFGDQSGLGRRIKLVEQTLACPAVGRKCRKVGNHIKGHLPADRSRANEHRNVIISLFEVDIFDIVGRMDGTVEVAAGFGGGDLFAIDKERAVIVDAETDHPGAILIKIQLGTDDRTETGSVVVHPAGHPVQRNRVAAFGGDFFAILGHAAVGGGFLGILDG